MDNHYYQQGRVLAQRLVARMTAEPEKAAFYAKVWVPASLVGAPTLQQIGFVEAAIEAASETLDDTIISFMPVFLDASTTTFKDRLDNAAWLKAYNTRLLA